MQKSRVGELVERMNEAEFKALYRRNRAARDNYERLVENMNEVLVQMHIEANRKGWSLGDGDR